MALLDDGTGRRPQRVVGPNGRHRFQRAANATLPRATERSGAAISRKHSALIGGRHLDRSVTCRGAYPPAALPKHTRCVLAPSRLAKVAAFELATFSEAADSSLTVEVATPHNAGLSGAGPSP